MSPEPAADINDLLARIEDIEDAFDMEDDGAPAKSVALASNDSTQMMPTLYNQEFGMTGEEMKQPTNQYSSIGSSVKLVANSSAGMSRIRQNLRPDLRRA